LPKSCRILSLLDLPTEGRMVASPAQDHGFPQPVIDLTLAHKERSRTRRAYLRSDRLPERRTLLEQWAEFATQNKVTDHAARTRPRHDG